MDWSRQAARVVLLTAATAAAPVAGQAPAPATAHPSVTAAPRAGAHPRIDAPPEPGSPLLALRSLAVPGWGQWAQGQRRGAAYAVVEAALWMLWVERRGRGGDLRDAYRDLAWNEARGRSGARRDGPWSYYEDLSAWTRSGAFDRDPDTPGIQPEDDPSTFNGSTWSLARSLHLGGSDGSPGDPRWASALTWYAERAYRDGFLWDWTGKESALAEYRDLIQGSDRRFRQATTALGAVLANHLLSAADAFVSSRSPGAPRVRLEPASGPGGHPASLHLVLRWAPLR